MVNHFRDEESLIDKPRSVSITFKGRSQFLKIIEFMQIELHLLIFFVTVLIFSNYLMLRKEN